MAAIKGQNVRLFLGDKCVAASTSCQLHIAAQIESKTTKDSPDGYEENECTGKSWDASIDALVVEKSHIVTLSNQEFTNWSSGTGGVQTSNLNIPANTGIRVCRVSSEHGNLNATISVSGTQIGIATDGEPVEYFNTSSSSKTLTITYNFHDSSTPIYDKLEYDTALTADDLLSKLGNERLQLKFAITTGTDHRTSSQVLKQGYCYLTDLSITAGNKQNSTFSAQLTGDGELETPSA